jgi:large subunit ribosomal protein LX
MSKNAFRIEGDFQMGRIRQHFNVEMVGTNEDDAREHLYKDIGSRHGAKRRDITITTVTPLDAASAGSVTRKRLE